MVRHGWNLKCSDHGYIYQKIMILRSRILLPMQKQSQGGGKETSVEVGWGGQVVFTSNLGSASRQRTKKIISVVVRGEKSFKEWSGVQLDGVGRSQERPKRISWWQNQRLFCYGIWVADFPFNQRLIQLYLYNHHQEFLQLQLVCYFHLRGKENNNLKLQKSAVCGVIPSNETTVIMAALCSNFMLSY